MLQTSKIKKVERKVITIFIVEYKNISNLSRADQNLKPFISFQFYNFEDSTTKVYVGRSSSVNEKFDFKIDFDALFTNYIETSNLEFFLFDDNTNFHTKNDIIGTALFPLKDIQKANLIERDLIVKSNSNIDTQGILSIKIDISNYYENPITEHN